MSEKFDEWAILELMGHRRLAGKISEQTIGGASFIRIDVPEASGGLPATQIYSPAAVYCITPVSEEVARAVASRNRPEPVHRWELPAPKPGGLESNADACEDEDEGDDLPL